MHPDDAESMLLEWEKSALREMPHSERKEDVLWVESCHHAGGQYPELESSKWQRKSSIWQYVFLKSRIKKKENTRKNDCGMWFISKHSWELCGFQKAKAWLRVFFKTDSGPLKEGEMNPAGYKKQRAEETVRKYFHSTTDFLSMWHMPFFS